VVFVGTHYPLCYKCSWEIGLDNWIKCSWEIGQDNCTSYPARGPVIRPGVSGCLLQSIKGTFIGMSESRRGIINCSEAATSVPYDPRKDRRTIRPAVNTPPITSDRKPTQQTTRHSRRGRTGRERPDVEVDVNEVGPRLQAATDRAACVADPQQQHQPPPPTTRGSLQGAAPRHGEGGQSSLRTAAPRHTACCGLRPFPAPAAARPVDAAPHHTSPANNNRPEEMRTSCCQQPAPQPSDAAKMSPHIIIGQEPVLVDHAPSLTAAGSHCQAREGSAQY